jgi:uncharacterized protein YndB with AHSA1/START domain
MKPDSDGQEHEAALTFEYELDAPPAQVWRAVTIPEFVAQWLTPGLMEPGAKTPAVSFRLLDEEPGRSVRYLWREETSPLPESLVTFRLHPNDVGGTTFRIVHETMANARILPRQSPANGNASPLSLAA